MANAAAVLQAAVAILAFCVPAQRATARGCCQAAATAASSQGPENDNSQPFVDRTAGRVFSDGSFRVARFHVSRRSFQQRRMPTRTLLVFVPHIPRLRFEAANGSNLVNATYAAPFVSSRSSWLPSRLRSQLRAAGNSRAASKSSAVKVPVLLFHHGFAASPWFYTSMLTRIASHGCIVVGPQMYYDVAVNTSSADDFKESARIITWLHSRLTSSIRRHLPLTASSPDWSSFFIGGHSWGGKLSFGVAQSLFAPLPLPLRGLIGFDPVDGLLDSPIVSPMVRHSPHSVDVLVPALIMAAGLGPVPVPGNARACAPAYYGPPSFFSDSAGPTVYFNLSNHGHVDFCDDSEWKASWDVCTPGTAAAPMRAAAAGLTVAFIEGVLSRNYTDLEAVYNNPDMSPTSLSDLQVYPSALPWT